MAKGAEKQRRKEAAAQETERRKRENVPQGSFQNYVKKEQELKKEILKEAEDQTEAQKDTAKAEQQEVKAEKKQADTEKDKKDKTQKTPKTKTEELNTSFAWILFIASIGLIILDIATKFNGIDINYFKNLEILMKTAGSAGGFRKVSERGHGSVWPPCSRGKDGWLRN